MFKEYLRLAYTNAKQRKRRALLTMIGIFIGIAAVVALISLSQGLQTAIAGQFVKLGSDKLVVQAAGGGFGPPGTAVTEPLTKKDKDIISRVKGVEIAVGRLIRIVQLEFKDAVRYGYAVSLPDDQRERELVVEVNNYNTKQGKLLDKHGSYDVLISEHMINDFFDEPMALRDRITIQGKEFTIVGILEESGNPQQDHTFVLPEETIRSILSLGEEYDIIPVKIKQGEDIASVKESIAKELRKAHNVEEGKEDFTIQTPEQILSTLNTIIIIIQGVLIGIAAISLLVGGIGIMNTMYTAVLERTKEIGILKAVGATPREIKALFLVESGLLGLVGGIIGVFLGIGISKLVEFIALQEYQTPLIHAEVNVLFLGGMLLFAFFLGALSGFFPARQAAQLQPVEALRG